MSKVGTFSLFSSAFGSASCGMDILWAPPVSSLVAPLERGARVRSYHLLEPQVQPCRPGSAPGNGKPRRGSAGARRTGYLWFHSNTYEFFDQPSTNTGAASPSPSQPPSRGGEGLGAPPWQPPFLRGSRGSLGAGGLIELVKTYSSGLHRYPYWHLLPEYGVDHPGDPPAGRYPRVLCVYLTALDSKLDRICILSGIIIHLQFRKGR